MGLPNIGPLELIIILAIALLIVGPGRLPEMGSAVGRTIREFRKAATDITDSTKIDTRERREVGATPNTLSDQATPNEMAPLPASQAATSPAAPATSVAAPQTAPAAPPVGLAESPRPQSPPLSSGKSYRLAPRPTSATRAEREAEPDSFRSDRRT